MWTLSSLIFFPFSMNAAWDLLPYSHIPTICTVCIFTKAAVSQPMTERHLSHKILVELVACSHSTRGKSRMRLALGPRRRTLTCSAQPLELWEYKWVSVWGEPRGSCAQRMSAVVPTSLEIVSLQRLELQQHNKVFFSSFPSPPWTQVGE